MNEFSRIIALTGVFLLLLFSGTLLHAQQPKTYERFEFELQIELLPDLDLEINPEIRFSNFLEFSELILQGGLRYKPFKFLKLSGYYRFIGDYTNDEPEYLHRFAFDAEPKYEINRLELEFRLRYANYTDFTGETGDNKSYYRYRLQAKYDIKSFKFNPHISWELFQKSDEKSVYKGRYEVGVEYGFNKKNELEIFYFLQDYYNKDKLHHIIGVKYQLEL
ncbi:MAG: DUF2490 domain-containing protein [Bacteroidales bacterium]|nr:DUF2490 domain-containing protein [Bacteroidales bacterium]